MVILAYDNNCPPQFTLLDLCEKPFNRGDRFKIMEKQRAYGKFKPSKVSNGFSLTPQARIIWGAVSGDIQVKILNNVWCVGCRDVTGIGNVSGKVERGMLVLKGVCTHCGGEVARVIEKE